MNLFSKIEKGSPLLHRTGFGMMAAALIFLLTGAFDQTQVLGISAWTKPIKFALSIAIFVWTIALFLEPLGNWFARRWIARVIAFSMIAELALITLQAGRGVPSHFNTRTSFDGNIFSAMGLLIVINTLAVAVVLLGYIWRSVDVHPLIASAIRMGLLFFLAGSLVGMFMVVNMGHTIGAQDGGAGLPFVNWSTGHGDLRIAHATGLHALQVFPLIALLILRFLPASSRVLQLSVLTVACLAYVAAFVFTLRQAVGGQPFLRL